MQVLERGHIYQLSMKNGGTQLLTFFKDLPATETGHDGVLCQEVLRALIDRMFELQRQVPCQESMEIIELLRKCLVLFEGRAARRSLEKSYAKTGLHIEQLPVHDNGHVLAMKVTR